MLLNEQSDTGDQRDRSWLGSLEWTYIKVRYPLIIGAVILAVPLLLIVSTCMMSAHSRALARSALHEARRAVYLVSPLVVDDEIKHLVFEAETELELAEAAYLKGLFGETQLRALTTQEIAERAMAQSGENGVVSLPARFLRIQGEVRVQPSGSLFWQRAAVANPLFPGDLIRTFSSSAAEILYEDGRVTTMSSDSMLQILTISQNKHTIHVKEVVEAGSIRVVAAAHSSPGSTHTVETQVADVRAMAQEVDLRVSLAEDGKELAVDVYNGRVTLGPDGDGQVMQPGTRSLVGAQGKKFKTAPMLAAPHLYSPAEAHLFRLKDSEKGVVDMSWSPIAGASTYELEIGRHSLLASPEVRLDSHPATTARVQGLATGWWFWRVLALDATGSPGFPSITGSFRIERVQPKPLANQSGGPSLELTRVMQAGRVFILIGRAAPGSHVSLDGGSPVIPEEDGRFTAALQLEEPGRHLLRLRATDLDGRESILEREIYMLE